MFFILISEMKRPQDAMKAGSMLPLPFPLPLCSQSRNPSTHHLPHQSSLYSPNLRHHLLLRLRSHNLRLHWQHSLLTLLLLSPARLAKSRLRHRPAKLPDRRRIIRAHGGQTHLRAPLPQLTPHAHAYGARVDGMAGPGAAGQRGGVCARRGRAHLQLPDRHLRELVRRVVHVRHRGRLLPAR